MADAVVRLKPIEVDGRTFERLGVRTRMVEFGDDIESLAKEYVPGVSKPGDWIALSEKVVSVGQNNARHISTVKIGWLARLIVKGVKKYPNDIAWEHPAKMQVAVDMAGTPRMLAALVLGGVTRLAGIHGVFWQIAGRVSEIDGFNPRAMYPYTEYAILPPIDPEGVVQNVEDRVGVPATIIDGNNIDVKIISMSRGMPVDAAQARLILLDNPMGQDEELTPIIVVREAQNGAKNTG
jgi:F420-0:gamma-glutamyl ligase